MENTENEDHKALCCKYFVNINAYVYKFENSYVMVALTCINIEPNGRDALLIIFPFILYWMHFSV